MTKECAIVVRNLTKFFHKDEAKRVMYLALVRSFVPIPFRKKLIGENNSFYALENITFSVGKGECLGIVGVNGSGKSTLLQILSGTMKPSWGEIKLKGRISSILELGSAFSADFTGIENIRLNLTLLGVKSSRLEEKIHEVAIFSEIGDYLNYPTRTYSSGMIMRLAFAVQIVSEPEVLIIDEALAVGDEFFQKKCFDTIKNLKDKGTSILLVSHSSEAILSLCDNALMLKEGKTFVHGSPKSVITIYHKSFLDKNTNDQDLISDFVALESEKAQVASDETINCGTSLTKKVSNRYDAQSRLSYNDPNLKKSTSVEYSNNNLKIKNCKILNEEGMEVNNLLNGNRYTFEYIVSVESGSELLSFGCMFKTIRGIEISGINTSRIIHDLQQTAEFKSYTLRFEFECVFLPNTYTVNAGVIEFYDGQEKFAARNVDAVLFKVIPWSENQEYGLVSMFREINIDGEVKVG